MALKFPPTPEEDVIWAPAIYNSYRIFSIHTDDDIVRFESRHKKRIEQRVEEKAMLEGTQNKTTKLLSDYGQLSFGSSNDQGVIHTPLPQDTGRVTRFTLALLYGAIVCKVRSNRILNKSVSELPETEKFLARAICTEYSTFMYADERMRADWLTWFAVIDDVHRLGLGAAIRKHQITFSDGTKVRLSGKHVKNIEQKVLQKKKDVATYSPAYLIYNAGFSHIIKNNPVLALELIDDFSKVEDSIYDQQVTYSYARIVHGRDDYCRLSESELHHILSVRQTDG